MINKKKAPSQARAKKGGLNASKLKKLSDGSDGKGGDKEAAVTSAAKASNRYLGQAGFTLLEVLMVIGILAILATIVLVAINPARQFKIARDSQRTANVASVLNAIGQNMADHSGAFVCEGSITALPSDETEMSSSGGFDMARCIVPDYISALPYDPAKDTAHYTDETDYDTGYSVLADVDGRVTISAEGELASTSISVTR